MGLRTMKWMVAVLLVSALPALAGSITNIGLFDTGDGSHYTVLSSGNPAVTVTQPPALLGLWVAGSTADWVSVQSDMTGWTASSDVNYTYWTSFDLTGYVLSTVTITGWWSADDFGALHLNGSATPVALTTIAYDSDGSTSYMAQHSFTLTAADGLLQNGNILAFGVNNKGNAALAFNPTGLIVEWTSFEGTQSAIPEPGALVLVGGGLVALGLVRRRW